MDKCNNWQPVEIINNLSKTTSKYDYGRKITYTNRKGIEYKRIDKENNNGN